MVIFFIMVCFGINFVFEVYEVFSIRLKFVVFFLLVGVRNKCGLCVIDINVDIFINYIIL